MAALAGVTIDEKELAAAGDEDATQDGDDDAGSEDSGFSGGGGAAAAAPEAPAEAPEGWDAAIEADDYDAVWTCLGAAAPAFAAGAEPEGSNAARAVAEFRGVRALKLAVPTVESDAERLRFLRARKGDVAAATEMLGNHVEWLGTFRPDLVVQADIPACLKTGCARLLGETDAGVAVALVLTSHWQPHLYDLEEYVKFLAYFHHHMSRNFERWALLSDLSGWRFGHATHLRKIKAGCDMLQNHYPERLAASVTMNAPWIFNATWEVITPWLDPRTVANIAFASGDDQIRAALGAARIPLAIVPSDYGGEGAPVSERPVPNFPGEADVEVPEPLS